MATLLSTDKALVYAQEAERKRDWATAIDLYKGVLTQFPKNKRALGGLNGLKPKAVQSLLQQAKDAQAAHHWGKSQDFLSLAFQLAPELPEIGTALAQLQLENGDPASALETAGAVLASHPNREEAVSIKAIALRDLGRLKQAKDLFETLPETADSVTNLAILARAEGDKAKETHLCAKAIELAPANPSVHWNYANVQTYKAGNAHLKQMRRLAQDMDPKDPQSAPLRMALFKAYDDMDERDEAFSHLQAANALSCASTRYDFKKDALRYALSKNIFASTQLPETQSRASGPIFVTGLPRSGTTLVERILAQDPRAKACGELSFVERATSRLMQRIIEGEIKRFSDHILQELHTEILDGFSCHADKDHRVIDKMPLNFRWIGYICAAIPEARIIHINRDPMAVAWALYRHAFVGLENGFSNAFEDIAKFMVLRRETMGFWKDVCPAHILEISNNDLVTNAETITRQLAEFTGLTWSPDWLHPERSEAAVLTASADQVRKPIYTGSDADWRRYAPQLLPLENMLKSAGLV